MANITFTNVNKSYPNGYNAVKDFNLEIKDREFVALVGASGCGKSTVLRMVAGKEDITSGEIKFGNTVINDIESGVRDITMIFKNYALHSHLNVYDNIALSLRLRRYPEFKIEERVNEIARFLNLEGMLERKPKALSGGQKQRLALARATVRKPSVILMDEPLANLKYKLRIQMKVEIDRVHKELGTTIIYVTDNLEEAMELADRIVFMKEGIIQKIGEPVDFVADMD